MTATDKPKLCPAAVRKDLFCALGRILQITEDGRTLFWGMCRLADGT